MSTRNRRISFTALSLCVALAATVALPTATLFTSVASNSASAAVPALTNVLRLSVQPAMPSSVTDGSWKDAVGSELKGNYKWLIQQDNSGDPNQPSGPVASNDGTLNCTTSSCNLHSPAAPFLYSAASLVANAACNITNFPTLDPLSPTYKTDDPTSPDLGTPVSWTPSGSQVPVKGYITAVCDAKDVILGRTYNNNADGAHPALPAFAVQGVAGTLLFSVLRADQCHPVTPITPTGNPVFPAAYNPINDPTQPVTTPATPPMPSCNWPSIHTQAHPPVVTQGEKTDWNIGQALSGLLHDANGKPTGKRCVLGVAQGGCPPALPDGKYFVSVTADGYEIGGASFTVPMSADANVGGHAAGTVKVLLNPGPLKLATMRLLVFDDMAPTGGAWEETTEAGMSGFSAFLTDFGGNGPVSQDYFGNPLCTTYKTDNSGNTLVNPDGTPTQVIHLGGNCVSQNAILGLVNNPGGLSANGTSLQIKLLPGASIAKVPPAPFLIQLEQEQVTVTAVGPVVNGVTTWTIARGANGTTAAPHALATNVPDPTNSPTSDGIITIPNLPPGHYGANVVPPDKGWIQTSTLEGSHEWDVWIMGNDTGLDNELTKAGEPVPWVTFGFARAAMANIDPGTGAIQPVNYSANPEAKTSGAFATAGCQTTPFDATGGELTPAGDVRAAWEKAMVPCDGTGITKRIDPGVPGQAPTPDGSLQADTWIYPYTNPLYCPANTTCVKPTGELKGNIAAESPYVPGVGGLNGLGGANGQAGEQVLNTPIADAWIALADLNNGDQTTMVFPARSDGVFDVKGIPDGTYNMAWWDWYQDYAFDQYQITIQNGQVVDVGLLPLTGWFTKIIGTVFIDKNGNGQKDPGEAGVPDFLMQLLNRTNNAYDGGQNVATTNDAGYYEFKEAYPLGNDMVLQFYNQRYKTTGVTCQSDNDPQKHTTITPAVDLTTLNIIGLNGRCDIGIQPYSNDPTANDNGGIVATAMYHPFRAEVSEEQSVTWPWDTGQPGLRFELWQPRTDGSGKGTYLTCDPKAAAPAVIAPWKAGDYKPCPNGLDGSLVKDPVPFTKTATGQIDTTNTSQVDVYYSEHYQRGGANVYSQPGCVPRGADGQVLDWRTQAAVLPGGDCVEAALQGTSFSFGSDGNPVDPFLYNGVDPTTKTKVGPTDVRSLDPGFNAGAYVNGTDGNAAANLPGKPIPAYPGLNDYCNALNGNGPIDPRVANINGSQCGVHGVQVVDGNYTLTPPNPGDYIVKVTFPNDMFGKPLYKWSTEATPNLYSGPGWTVQDPSGTMSWQPGLQAAAIQDLKNQGKLKANIGMSLTPSTNQPFASAKCVGALSTINNTDPGQTASYVDNPSYVIQYGGSPPFEGTKRALCDEKLIHVQNGQSVAPNFLMYTDVPLATKFSGYATDDISVSTNKVSTGLGEVQPIPNLPIGIYDWTNRLVTSVNTDTNGQWEVMLPSTNTFNANTVSGLSATVYQFVGNDPGQPSAPNLNWNPAYKTISAFFQAFPDVFEPSDVAPQRVVASFEGNGTQLSAAVVCAPRASQPQVFALSHPFFKPTISTVPGRRDTYKLVIQGVGFGTQPTDKDLGAHLDWGVTLRSPDATNIDPSGIVARFPNGEITAWSDTEIDITLGTGSNGSVNNRTLQHVAPGPYQLVITNASGVASQAGLTFHVLGAGYNPHLIEVGPYATGVVVTNPGSPQTLRDTQGNPLGILGDNGFISTTVPRSNGPVQDLVDSTVGFNPNNRNFLPAGTAGAINTGAPPPNGGTRPNGTAGDSHVKGAVQRALEAASHFWDPNIGTVSGAGINANTTTNLRVALNPGQTLATLPGNINGAGNITTPFTITIGAEQIQVSGHVTIANNGIVTFAHLLRGFQGTTAVTHGGGSTVLAKMDVSSIGTLQTALPGNSNGPGSINVQLTGGTSLLDLRTPLVVTIGQEQLRVGSAALVDNTGTVNASTPNTLVTLSGIARRVRGTQRAAHAVGAAVQIPTATQDQNLVVVYPNLEYNTATKQWGGQAWDPLSAYFENIIVHSPVMLQGSGPGGFYKDNSGATIATPGATLDGRFINSNTGTAATTTDSFAGNEPWAFDWTQLIGGDGNADGLSVTQPYSNSVDEVEGMVVYVVSSPGRFRHDANGYQPSVDGFGITGGDQKGFPQTINEATGLPTPAPGGPEGGNTFGQEVQGGAVMFEADTTHFQLSNNLIQWNSGTYGSIRSGAPQFGNTGDPVSRNYYLHLHHNRIEENGGTNLAGGIGLFRGTDAYRINDNSICGNLSAEYGGGISHFGFSPWGQIDHNRIDLNQAIDEGSGIIIAGEPPLNATSFLPDPNLLSMGAGDVSIHDNYIGDNVAYDDGGGLRFLEAGVGKFDVSNNMLTNNVSAHEGGGVAIDNAPNVQLVNDTIANNVTTATAVTSTGDPAPAGVSTTNVSGQLKDFLHATGLNKTIPVDTPAGTRRLTCAQALSPTYAATAATTQRCANLAMSPISNPVMFNDVIWDNLAGSWDQLNGVVGACLPSNGRDPLGQPNGLSPCQFSTPASLDGLPTYDVGGEPTGTGHLIANSTQVGNTVDPGPNIWDLGTADSALGTTLLKPTHSLITDPQGWASGQPAVTTSLHDVDLATNANADPRFVQQYVSAIQSDQYRLQPRFRPGNLITLNLPANVLGDYHLQSTSPVQLSTAYRLGAHTADPATVQSKEQVTAPPTDIDLDVRPVCPDSGADQIVAGANQVCPAAAPVGGGGAVGLVASGPGGGAGGTGDGGGAVRAILTAVRVGEVSNNHTHVRPPITPPPAPGPVNKGSNTPPASPQTRNVSGFQTAGGANAAGNTAVVATPGAAASLSNGAASRGAGSTATGAPGAPASGQISPAPAGMPGGTAGGGHFVLPVRKSQHTKSVGGGGSSTWALWLTIPAACAGALGTWVVGRRRQVARRRRRRRPSHLARGATASPPPGTDPPPDDLPATGREVALAGKGDRS